MTAPATTHDEHDVDHPDEKQYIVIGLILAGLTAIEVGLYYFNLGAVNNAVLIALAIAKFAIVSMYFMHLKFDHPILRRLFVTGIVLAVGVYMIYLVTLGVFIDPVGVRGGGPP